ncbi:MAG: hypothetical protein MPJ50_15515 [Pirellulales bacterium]|nr:hypothetical protein [Pirellulales bacterium]
MPVMDSKIFDELRTSAATDPTAALQRLIECLLEQRQFHQAFDASLMAIRLRLGLPVIWTGKLDDVDDKLRTEIEEGYLDACRMVGFRLLEADQPGDAWYYLRHLTDRRETTSCFENYTPGDESREDYINVAVHEGVAPVAGFRQVLDHYGICNAITLFDSAMSQQPREQRLAVAPLLIADLHAQLQTNLRSEIQQQSGSPPAESMIADMIADRDWLFGEHAYHVDTSHLSAVVRFAREVEAADVLRLALDLCRYGLRLDKQFQFASEEPFADTYTAHAVWFEGLLSANSKSAAWQTARDYFRAKAENLSYEEHGAGPAEVYVAFLAKTGHPRDALTAIRQFIPAGAATSGFAPAAAELAAASGEYDLLAEIGAERNEIVTFATGVLAAAQKESVHSNRGSGMRIDETDLL